MKVLFFILLGLSTLFANGQRRIEVNDKSYIVCVADPTQFKIEAFNQGKDGLYTFQSIAKEKKGSVIFAMNAGMFDSERHPVGLLVTKGKIEHPFNGRKAKRGLWNWNWELGGNSVFLVDSQQVPHIVLREDYPDRQWHPMVATQSGPILVYYGDVNPLFQKSSNSLTYRNGVGINKNGEVVMVVSQDPVNFYEFAMLFKKELHCENALFMDGEVSQCYVPSLDGPNAPDTPLGPILTISKK